MTDLYSKLNVSRFATDVELKSAFRAIARACHPDTCPNDVTAAARFAEVSAAYHVLSDARERALYDERGMSVLFKQLSSKTDVYEVDGLFRSGDLSDVFAARRKRDGERVVLKVARHPSVNDLMFAESRRLTELAAVGGVAARYLPVLLDTFEADDKARRRVNVLRRLDDYVTLEDVRAFGGVAVEHAAWVFNRLLEGLDCVHRAGYVYGAGVPSNVMVWLDPRGHLVKLVDWGYGARVGERLRAAVPGQERFYPADVLRGAPATTSTDVHMAAELALYVAGDVAPQYFKDFMRGCTTRRGQVDAWQVHEEFASHMEKYYGPKRFVPFENPGWTRTQARRS